MGKQEKKLEESILSSSKRTEETRKTHVFCTPSRHSFPVSDLKVVRFGFELIDGMNKWKTEIVYESATSGFKNKYKKIAKETTRFLVQSLCSVKIHKHHMFTYDCVL
jgi:hypothetical protein